jgi:hypothetical protein
VTNAGLPTQQSTLTVDSSCSNSELSEFYPFNNLSQWLLGKAVLYPKRLSTIRIETIAVEKNCPWIQKEQGFRSAQDFLKRLDAIPCPGGEWLESNVILENSPSWMPTEVKFWFRDSLDALKHMVGNMDLSNDMKWAPARLFNQQGARLYSELWSGDWWWRKQVRSTEEHRLTPL